MIVMKFGGTSVKDVEAVRRVVGVVAREKRTPLVVVSGFDHYSLASVTRGSLGARLAAGTLELPCGAEAAVALTLGVPNAVTRACVPADQLTAQLDPASTKLALIPPALVTPRVRVIPIEGADLFGEKPARSAAYPLVIPVPAAWPAAWTAWNGADVRVVVTTGVNCPDRGVSHQTVVLGRGWDWLLQGGTARYTGTHWDSRYGWTVVDAVRTGHAGAVVDLVRNADVAVSDFECSMTPNFVQHDSGTVFSIDPRVAPLMAKAASTSRRSQPTTTPTQVSRRSARRSTSSGPTGSSRPAAGARSPRRFAQPSLTRVGSPSVSWDSTRSVGPPTRPRHRPVSPR
jgi:hypothetical protein